MMPSGGYSASSGVSGSDTSTQGGGSNVYSKTVYMLPEAPGMPAGVPTNIKSWLWPAVAMIAIVGLMLMSRRR